MVNNYSIFFILHGSSYNFRLTLMKLWFIPCKTCLSKVGLYNFWKTFWFHCISHQFQDTFLWVSLLTSRCKDIQLVWSRGAVETIYLAKWHATKYWFQVVVYDWLVLKWSFLYSSDLKHYTGETCHWMSIVVLTLLIRNIPRPKCFFFANRKLLYSLESWSTATYVSYVGVDFNDSQTLRSKVQMWFPDEVEGLELCCTEQTPFITFAYNLQAKEKSV